MGSVSCYIVLFHTTSLDLLHRVLISGGVGLVMGIMALFLVTAGILVTVLNVVSMYLWGYLLRYIYVWGSKWCTCWDNGDVGVGDHY